LSEGNEMPPLLEVSNLHTYFFLKEGIVRAVSGVDLVMERERIVGIVGESGSGKSTLGFSLIRLIRNPGRIVRGEIRFLGEDLLKKTERDMEAIRGNKVSMIFQDPVTYLNPSCKVGYQISESILLHKKANRKEALAQSIAMLRDMGIPSSSERAMNYPHQLSGGMCQRVLIAMALCCEPDLLIADEPTTALDVTIQAQILQLIKKIRELHKTSIILITHDLGIVARMCDDVAIMYAGKIVEYADVHTIFGNPRHPYTIGLIHSIPKISFHSDEGVINSDISLKQQRLQTIPGQPPDLSKLVANQCSFFPRCSQAIKECQQNEPVVKNINSAHWIRCFLEQ
jgi:oligopeptide/dipeptide ABC transporter ATP-binding protein